jgi:hypothetical protein
MCIDERRQRRSLRALYPAGTLVHAAWDYAIQHAPHVTRERELIGIWPLKSRTPGQLERLLCGSVMGVLGRAG